MLFFFVYSLWIFSKGSRLVGAFLFSSIVTMLLKFIFFFISFCFDLSLTFDFAAAKHCSSRSYVLMFFFLTETWYGVYCHVTVAVRLRSIIRAQHRLFHYLVQFLEGYRHSLDL